MPGTCCCVPMSSNRGGFIFPLDEYIRSQWIFAVKRDSWKPTNHSVVCAAHFPDEDFVSFNAHTLNTTGKLTNVKVHYSQILD